ncbi:isocitrate lyase/PEP mutase family protein [Limobrevibacterium gyesilva]|uniref:Isocitrate lyase/phosphoenolpyruvate mutase family protein n=1 Tax=Limobrevibacterium gyesilva TaxID=2991712 RepID=A0AA41YLG4_9PROT|nr:isocitrate lyase/phosphoenolpyruvate mutase family protein [Limobrevibacterium gyesilva]MCW3475629.1 isocitrate lyase/phosphoenolpyruvate mutase family protein [Limobrevibacterium gyesilva]
MSFTDRRQRFRAILAGTRCVHPGSVFDPISARIAEDLGFEVGMFAGSIASFTVLGAPDIVVLTLTEFADQIRRITRAGALPLLVDADHGYGNALNVMRTVQELEAAGVAAMTIEDTLLPRAYGDGRTQLLSIEEGLGKVRAALAARTDPALTIVARTSAVAVTGLDDAVERARAYTRAGADALFFTGIGTPEQLRAIRAETPLPIILGGTDGDLGGRDGMGALGVRVALQGHQPFMAAVKAVHDTLKALREGTAPKDLAGQPSGELMKHVTRDASYAEAIRSFMGGK